MCCSLPPKIVLGNGIRLPTLALGQPVKLLMLSGFSNTSNKTVWLHLRFSCLLYGAPKSEKQPSWVGRQKKKVHRRKAKSIRMLRVIPKVAMLFRVPRGLLNRPWQKLRLENLPLQFRVISFKNGFFSFRWYIFLLKFL